MTTTTIQFATVKEHGVVKVIGHSVGYFATKKKKQKRRQEMSTGETNKTRRLHIKMAYTFVGDTGINVPEELLEGLSEEKQLEVAYHYAMEHIQEIPVAENAEYIADSDVFEFEDISWEHTTSPQTGYQDAFYVSVGQERVNWMYYNPDSNSYGQYVTNMLTFDQIREAAEKELSVEGFFDYLGSIADQVLDDAGTQQFYEADEAFWEKPDLKDCTDETMRELIRLSSTDK